MSLMKTPCVGINSQGQFCREHGRMTCKNCNLVVYCSLTCQITHWVYHAPDCRAEIGRPEWFPDWIMERRDPEFLADRDEDGKSIALTFTVPLRGIEDVWNRVPAFDVLNLGANEGKKYPGELRVLFAASKDLGNLVTTVVALPTYAGPVEFVVHGYYMKSATRDICILLVALFVKDKERAVDTIIHIWYSASIRPVDVSILQDTVLAKVNAIYQKIKDRPDDHLAAKTWNQDGRSVRVILQTQQWRYLVSLLQKIHSIPPEEARLARFRYYLGNEVKDYREHQFAASMRREHRVPTYRFWADGILLPYGELRTDFRVPNPYVLPTSDIRSMVIPLTQLSFLFQDGTFAWLAPVDADPLKGWPRDEVEQQSSGPASADIYGKLFFFLRRVLTRFLLRWEECKLKFEVNQSDISEWRETGPMRRFSRIETSNLADNGKQGMATALRLMSPLLETKAENPHATMITCFNKMIYDQRTPEDVFCMLKSQTLDHLAEKLLGRATRSPDPLDPFVCRAFMAKELLISYENLFNRYHQRSDVDYEAYLAEMSMKVEHTIIAKWPYRLKADPEHREAKKEFFQIVASGLRGAERYIEWKRK